MITSVCITAEEKSIAHMQLAPSYMCEIFIKSKSIGYLLLSLRPQNYICYLSPRMTLLQIQSKYSFIPDQISNTIAILHGITKIKSRGKFLFLCCCWGFCKYVYSYIIIFPEEANSKKAKWLNESHILKLFYNYLCSCIATVEYVDTYGDMIH